MIKPLKITGISTRVLGQVRDLIITGELAPGERLSETDLASKLGVSRQPLREAFRVLENEYLLINIPRKATYVTELSVKDFQEVYKARQMIEMFSVDLIKEKRIEDLSVINDAIEAERKLSSKNIKKNRSEMLNYLREFAEFHLKLVEIGGNSRLIRFYKIIASNLARYQFLHIFTKGRAVSTVKEHEDIFHAIQKKEYEAAKNLLKYHIEMVFESIEKELRISNAKAFNSE